MFAALRQFSIFERLHDCHLDGLKEEKLSNEKLKKKRDFVKVFQVKKKFFDAGKNKIKYDTVQKFYVFYFSTIPQENSLYKQKVGRGRDT